MNKKHLSREVLLNLYETMVKIRLCEEGFVEPILKKEVRCPVHLYSGEEAIAAGVCAALTEKDYIFGNHRSHGHYIAKGGGVRELVAEVYGRETGCCRGRGGSMHLTAPEMGMLGAAPIVAGTISLALGAALACRIRNDGRVTVSFFGDGATGEGVLYESLNFAALKKLPIIFVCENNLYSTHLPISECRISDRICGIEKPFRIRGRRTDGNDVLRVHQAAREAVTACRRGNGPVFLEFVTYRLRGHVGPDDNVQGAHTDIRPKKEIAAWRKKDPIKRFEKLLLKNGIADRKNLAEISAKTAEEVNDAFLFARGSVYPNEAELTKYVFTERS